MLISLYFKKFLLNFEMHKYYRFLIGRENNSENSEIAQLISQSIQADKEHQKPTIYQVVFSLILKNKIFTCFYVTSPYRNILLSIFFSVKKIKVGIVLIYPKDPHLKKVKMLLLWKFLI